MQDLCTLELKVKLEFFVFFPTRPKKNYLIHYVISRVFWGEFRGVPS